MEALVAHHSGHIIVRLPQVAGRTPNLYTLLNFLHRHICRGERFTLYKNASRNIIDIDDVVTIVKALVSSKSVRGITLNVANPTSSPVSHLVATMEKVAGRSEEHTSELQSLMRISYAVFCLKKKKATQKI